MDRRIVALTAALGLACFAPVAAAQDATPLPGREVPAPEECLVEPRPVVGQGTPTPVRSATPIVPPIPSSRAAAGTPAATPDAVAVAAIDATRARYAAAVQATVREFAACLNADEPLRAAALLTDDYVARVMEAAGTDGPDPSDAIRFATGPEAPGQLAATAIFGVWLASADPEGDIVSSVETEEALIDVVLVAESGRHRIDGLFAVDGFTSGASPEPVGPGPELGPGPPPVGTPPRETPAA